jgi:arylsulfatase A-like enzyme
MESSGFTASGKVGVGSHGGSSSAELHNTLIASGPSFVSGVNSEIPSGNSDVAPTVLAMLGIPQPKHFDGRVLTEALNSNVSGDYSDRKKITNNLPSASIRNSGHEGTTYLCEFG